MEFCLRYTDMLSRVSMKGCPTVQQPEPVMRFHWTTSTASIAINAYASQLARETRCCHSYRTKNSPHSTSMKTTNRSKCSYSSELPAMAKASTPQLMRITSWYTSFWKWWQGNYGRALFNKVSIKLNISVLPHVNCEGKDLYQREAYWSIAVWIWALMTAPNMQAPLLLNHVIVATFSAAKVYFAMHAEPGRDL